MEPNRFMQLSATIPVLLLETAIEIDYENKRKFYRTTVLKGF